MNRQKSEIRNTKLVKQLINTKGVAISRSGADQEHSPVWFSIWFWNSKLIVEELTRTRTNTNPNGTEANAAGRSCGSPPERP